jgi:protein-disulfide isomerase
LIEFADFQCPYCQSFYRVLQSVQQRYPNKIALTFVHLPLPFHEFAQPLAQAAECAADQGRFQELYDYLFQHAESLAQLQSGELANAARVQDVARFEACTRNDTELRRIVEGKDLAKEFDVKGTPTLLINGWKLTASPTSKEFGEMIEAVLQGKPPGSGFARVSHDGS